MHFVRDVIYPSRKVINQTYSIVYIILSVKHFLSDVEYFSSMTNTTASHLLKWRACVMKYKIRYFKKWLPYNNFKLHGKIVLIPNTHTTLWTNTWIFLYYFLRLFNKLIEGPPFVCHATISNCFYKLSNTFLIYNNWSIT